MLAPRLLLLLLLLLLLPLLPLLLLFQFKSNMVLAFLRNGSLNLVPVVFGQQICKFMQWIIIELNRTH